MEPQAVVANRRSADHYDRVAFCYEAIACFGSLGVIPRLKLRQLDRLPPGARILYVGAGAGEDVVAAAQRGFSVSALDQSPRMLARLRRRLAGAGCEARLIHGEVREFRGEGEYDVVVANFFLNVFDPGQARAVLARCRQLLRVDGLLLIGDFRPPGPGFAARVFHYAYYAPLNLVAWLLGLCALHPIYDYARWFDRSNLVLIERCAERLGENVRFAPGLYETIIARAK